MFTQWLKLMQAFNFTENNDVFDKLINAYSEKHRAYHNVNHLQDCLMKLENYPDKNFYKEIALAFWFHDAVYQSYQKNNELKSAEWANNFLENNKVELNKINFIFDLIMSTSYQKPAANLAQEIMMDIDISILGSEPENYEVYTKNVRKEYQLIPMFIYKKKRKAILQNFLKQNTLFYTNYFQKLYEKQARENIQNEIELLS